MLTIVSALAVRTIFSVVSGGIVTTSAKTSCSCGKGTFLTWLNGGVQPAAIDTAFSRLPAKTSGRCRAIVSRSNEAKVIACLETLVGGASAGAPLRKSRTCTPTAATQPTRSSDSASHGIFSTTSIPSPAVSSNTCLRRLHPCPHKTCDQGKLKPVVISVRSSSLDAVAYISAPMTFAIAMAQWP